MLRLKANRVAQSCKQRLRELNNKYYASWCEKNLELREWSGREERRKAVRQHEGRLEQSCGNG